MAVFHRTHKRTTTFGRLPKGAVFYLASGNGPFVKMKNGYELVANSVPQTSPGGTAVAASTSVVIVDKAFMRTQCTWV
jgi:hypothetical protein